MGKSIYYGPWRSVEYACCSYSSVEYPRKEDDSQRFRSNSFLPCKFVVFHALVHVNRKFKNEACFAVEKPNLKNSQKGLTVE